MATACISKWVDVKDMTRFPFRKGNSYVSLLHEGSGQVEAHNNNYVHGHGHNRRYSSCKVVDSVSCRQLYMRNAGYKFSREESVQERTKKCFGRVKVKAIERVAIARLIHQRRRKISTKLFRVKRVLKDFSADALRTVFQRLLSCTATVDVVEHRI